MQNNQANKSGSPGPTILAGGLLCLAAILVYWGVWNFDFVYFDDNIYISENPLVKAGLTWDSLWAAFTSTPGELWVPLTWLSYMVDYELFGLKAGGYHLVNLLLHLANILLLFFLLIRATAAYWPSLLVAALFALHPLHVESVAWVAERKDVLSTLFWFLTLHAYWFYAKKPGPGRYVPVFLFMLLGLLAKPMLVTLPFGLLLLDYWPLNRYRSPQADSGHGKPAGRSIFVRLLLEKIPLFGLSVLFSIITFTVQYQKGVVASLADFPATVRISNALISYVLYLRKMVYPFDLAIFYPHPGDSIPTWQPLLAGLALAAVSVLAIRWRRKRPFFLVGWFWYLLTLLPVSGISLSGQQAMADRFVYVPLLGIYIALAWSLPDIVKEWRWQQKAVVATAGAVVIFLAVIGWQEVQYWRNSATIFTRALAVTDDNAVVHLQFAQALSEDNKSAAAIRHYRRVLDITPNPIAHYNLGVILSGQGEAEQAVAHYEAVLSLDPGHREACNNIGIDLMKLGRYDESARYLKEVVQLDPNDFRGHISLGNLLTVKGEPATALSHYGEALRLNPDSTVAHYSMGYALKKTGRFNEAARHFRAALRLAPGLTQAQVHLADTLKHIKKPAAE